MIAKTYRPFVVILLGTLGIMDLADGRPILGTITLILTIILGIVYFSHRNDE